MVSHCQHTNRIYFHWAEDVLLQVLVKSRSAEILLKTFPITLKLDMLLDSSAAKTSVKFQSDSHISTFNFAALILYDIYNTHICHGTKTVAFSLITLGTAKMKKYIMTYDKAAKICKDVRLLGD